MTRTTPRSADRSQGLSRRDVLARLGWGGGAISMLGAGPLPDFGELRIEGLPAAQNAAIRLSSNENPYGMCQAARDRLQAEVENANRYPFAWSAPLHGAVARHVGVAESNVALGAGSTEILRMCAVAWSERGVLQAEPTFETLGSYTRKFGNRVVGVPVDAEGRHDLNAMSDRLDEAGVIYICNPSNPASTLLPQSELDAFLDRVPGDKLVIIDEAYHEFVDAPDYHSQVERSVASSNIVVIRTFSKIYGMAGMRVGYVVGPRALVRQLDAHRTEMSIGVISAACATASIEDPDYAADQKRLNLEARSILEAGLERLGRPVWESQTNFVMCDLGRPMMPVNRAMADRGVAVGRLFPALPNGLRISVGTPAQMHRCVDALEAVLA
ncbi:MAG: aminotransferase class I/II-fold pyridoxal phosphate-dependent enzyme [Acidobacteria bacterium]|nr:aminotransferase class I/II-fold pyridoxal phosphate-dependent enzyme [Acidobacteriota bacterium]